MPSRNFLQNYVKGCTQKWSPNKTQECVEECFKNDLRKGQEKFSKNFLWKRFLSKVVKNFLKRFLVFFFQDFSPIMLPRMFSRNISRIMSIKKSRRTIVRRKTLCPRDNTIYEVIEMFKEHPGDTGRSAVDLLVMGNYSNNREGVIGEGRHLSAAVHLFFFPKTTWQKTPGKTTYYMYNRYTKKLHPRFGGDKST